MTKGDLFIKYHWRSIISLGILVVAVAFLNPALYSTQVLSKGAGAVKGEAIVVEPLRDQSVAAAANIQYQTAIRSILPDYFAERSKYSVPSPEWLYLLDRVRSRVVTLSTPDYYKDLQLGVVSALDNEKTALTSGLAEDVAAAENQWQKIFAQFYWLE